MNTKFTSNRPARAAQGFSLVELMAFVCILGVLTSIALPAFGSSQSQAALGRDRHNAQDLANLCRAAQAAGLDFTQGTDLNGTINRILAGGRPAQGVFAGQVFKIEGVTESDIAGAKRFLTLDRGTLRYHSSAVN